MKRYKVGGPTEYSESGSAGGSKVSFGEAFKSARKQGLDEFTWRGKKYTTEMKEEKSDSKADKPSVRKVSTKEFIENYEKSPASGRMRQEAYYKANPEPGLKAVDEEMFSPGVKIAGAAGAGAALGYGAKKLKDFLSRKGMERAGKKLAEEGVPSDAARKAARESAKERRASSPARREREYDERLSSDMAGGYKRGGSVKSSASRRADGIASRGKTRGKFV
jgi:hypothetical protein